MDYIIYARIIFYSKHIFHEFFGSNYPTELIGYITMIAYNLIRINCGFFHACAIVDKIGYVWGASINTYKSDFAPYKVNLPRIKSMKCGNLITVALVTDGSVYVWGSESYCAKLNISFGSDLSRPSKLPIQSVIKIQVNQSSYDYGLITKNKIYCVCDHELISNVDITNVAQIKFNYPFIIIRTNLGKLYYMNTNGTNFKEHPLLKHVIKIDCGELHGIILTLDGELYVWEEINGLYDKVLLPTKSKIISARCGSYHTMVLLENHEIYVWGSNMCGQLGLDHYNNVNLPQKLNLFKNFIRIRCGGHYSVAVTTDGIYGWGSNKQRQLGLDTDVAQQKHTVTYWDRIPSEPVPIKLQFQL